MIELALQTKREEDQGGNTPGVSTFEPAPTFCQIIFPGRSSFSRASTVERAEYGAPGGPRAGKGSITSSNGAACCTVDHRVKTGSASQSTDLNLIDLVTLSNRRSPFRVIELRQLRPLWNA